MKKFFQITLPVLLAAALINIAFTTEESWEEKVEPALLEQTAAGEDVKFLIILEDNVDFTEINQLTKNEKASIVYDQLRQRADQTQANVVNFLNAQNAPVKAFFIVNMIYTEGNADLIQAVAEMPEVQRVQTNPVAKVERLAPNPEASLREPTWGVSSINADDAWADGYRGQGVIVGGQDTGYEWEHPAIKEKYNGWDGTDADHNYNWHDAIHEQNPLNDNANNPCGFDVNFPCDDNNHGTHTMGTMVGRDNEADIDLGVAPDAKWIACRNMDRGWGQLTTYVECFEFFLAPTDLNGENADPSKAPHVIANSWGCPEIEGCNPDNFAVMEAAVNNLRSAGTVVVVSAGNSGGQGCGSVSNPAAIFENSFSVGASNQAGEIAGFSSRGPVTVDGSGRMKPDIAAPGVSVYSCIRNGQYASFNGTSMAGPHIAGVVALMISANPALAGQVDTIEDLLRQAANNATSEEGCGDLDGEASPNNVYGWGVIDAQEAVNAALALLSSTDDVISDLGIQIAPNPFTDFVTLTFAQDNRNAQIEFYNTAGKIIKIEKGDYPTGSTASLDMSLLPAGVYFYKVKSEAGTVGGKLVKN